MTEEFKKGNEVVLSITGISSEGKGISKSAEGFVIFVSDALPGDRVKAVIKKRKNNYAEAETIEIMEKSPDRVDAKCRHFGTCGGCKIQNYAYGKQLEFKTESVKSAFEKIGGFENLDIPLALKTDNEYFYRNKMEFSFSDEKWMTEVDLSKERERFALGLHIPKFHSKILDIEECFLQSEVSARIVNFSRDFFKTKGLSIYSTRTHEGYLRFLIIRQCSNTKDFMVNLITHDFDKELMTEYAGLMKEKFPEVTTLLNSLTQKKAQVAFAEDIIILYGKGFIEEKLKRDGIEYNFNISPNAFFQTNTKQAEKLYSKVVEFGDFKKTDRVLDLYCGTGSISIFISDLVESVKGAELIEESILSAEENAKLNGIENVQFITTDIKDFLNEEGVMHGYNKIILDPPRSGLHPDICEVLSGKDFEKIVYVSCNPSTQARDLKIIMSGGRYEIGRIQPVDMFPQTYHIENVVELNLKRI
ncbi:MAG: 23S rRNA (uracil(1939)-C(5))-methyltransferase RlmD [Ignavibacteria bacterium]|nr:23S rRNA (uracil(1939)-C(5))-methyltransferase RlmD [Ignavibacteria bacterium]